MNELRRRKEKRTDYRKRLKLLLSRKIRLIIRKSNRAILCQFVEYKKEGDKILTSLHSKKIVEYTKGLKKSEVSYLTGYIFGLQSKALVKEAILDIGLQNKGSRIFTTLKGVVDSGIKVPCDSSILPDEKVLDVEKLKKKGDEIIPKLKAPVKKDKAEKGKKEKIKPETSKILKKSKTKK